MIVLPSPIVHHPFAYEVGPLQITGFGIAILMCFVVAQAVAQRELVRRGHDPEPMADMIFAALVGGLLGAKLYYVVVLGHWDSIFDRGGFVYWGGLIGGMLAVMGVVVHKRAGLMKMFDVSAPALAAAYAVGRTGCWAVGDDYGRPWKGFLSVAFPEGAPPSTAGIMARDFGIAMPAGANAATVLSVYPTQLYEVAMGLAMFFILWRLRDHVHAEGWLFGVYAVLSGLERFVIEFLRAKDDRLLAGLTYAQVIALAFMALGVGFMVWRWRVGDGKRGIYAVVPAT
ncbi:MAG TPA: prolipoprotein diacylglyceryl transferase family protein [Gemmatimonadaceae bacterium]|nr:prolipoprotein diacylglyceryl transferase family protein [Gemmatimonadaceae bacterium]